MYRRISPNFLMPRNVFKRQLPKLVERLKILYCSFFLFFYLFLFYILLRLFVYFFYAFLFFFYCSFSTTKSFPSVARTPGLTESSVLEKRPTRVHASTAETQVFQSPFPIPWIFSPWPSAHTDPIPLLPDIARRSFVINGA